MVLFCLLRFKFYSITVARAGETILWPNLVLNLLSEKHFRHLLDSIRAIGSFVNLILVLSSAYLTISQL